VGGKFFNLPEQAAVLLQQAFEAMSNNSDGMKNQVEENSAKGKAVAMIEPVEEVPKPLLLADGAESSHQGAAGKEGSGKSPYCFRCKTKWHAIEECHARMFCDICESPDHVRLRCPKFRAVKGAAVPCGFAVEGLGFLDIPFESLVKQCIEGCSVLIRVSDGVLSIQNVIAEVDSGKLGMECGSSRKWFLPYGFSIPIGAFAYGRVGVVHSKFQNTKLWIEERLVDNEVKYVLPKVWVQFTELPPHLRDFLIIWAVGSILGVSKDVDMVFTRRFAACKSF
jgi:hypothetical protein